MNKYPPIVTQIWNFIKALFKHTKSGFKCVDVDMYIIRINICNPCEEYDNGNCTKCGCPVDKKAWWTTEECPINKWPKL